MRKRTKYQTGDILENWDCYRNVSLQTVRYHMVVKVYKSTCPCNSPNYCSYARKTLSFYKLKDLENERIFDIRAYEIDHVSMWSYREGWRKVA